MTIEGTVLTDISDLPERFPYPYTPESFTPEEQKVLKRFFTNTYKPVFAIFNLPQEVVGAIFSRYSRSDKSVRKMFLDEFYGSKELGIQNIADYLEEQGEDLGKAKEKAEKFYERVFAEYGDDSVIQMGSVHIAFEGVSQIAAKVVEDQRIGAAYIEKSTRYVRFDNKNQNGHYLFAEVPEIMSSEFAQEFIDWNNSLFEAYSKHIPLVLDHFRNKYPIQDQKFVNPKTGEEAGIENITDFKEREKAQKAYERALLAKTLDTLRVFLPTTTVTNLGAHFSGQAAENAINKMLSSPSSEVRLLGTMAYQELSKVAPSFLRNVDHKYGRIQRKYLSELKKTQEDIADKWLTGIGVEDKKAGRTVRLVDWDEDADVKIAAQILYKNQTKTNLSKSAVLRKCRKIKADDLAQNPDAKFSPTLARIIIAAVPDRAAGDRTRRQKLPRAFESADAECEFYINFGVYRDLQRNRMSSTEKVRLNASEIDVPVEFYEKGMEPVLADYLDRAEATRDLNMRMRLSQNQQLSEMSEYVTMLGNKLRFTVRANVRQWAFFDELRTIEGGHKTYRRAMQLSAKQMLYVWPFLRALFAHVNWKADYGLGRLKSEFRTQTILEEVN